MVADAQKMGGFSVGRWHGEIQTVVSLMRNVCRDLRGGKDDEVGRKWYEKLI
jgi:hypothetical protein